MTTHIESSEEHESEDREDLKRRALAAIGRFRSDVTDLGVEHDRYLEEAFGSKRVSRKARRAGSIEPGA